MKDLVLSVLLLSAASSFAGKHAPLPDEITTAKTVYLVNNTGEQKVVDSAYEQFTKWGRFSVVTKKDAADLVIVFDQQMSNFHQGTTYSVTRMDVFLKGQDEAAYEATERTRSLFGSPIKECVGDFRNRLEAR